MILRVRLRWVDRGRGRVGAVERGQWHVAESQARHASCVDRKGMHRRSRDRENGIHVQHDVRRAPGWRSGFVSGIYIYKHTNKYFYTLIGTS